MLQYRVLQYRVPQYLRWKYKLGCPACRVAYRSGYELSKERKLALSHNRCVLPGAHAPRYTESFYSDQGGKGPFECWATECFVPGVRLRGDLGVDAVRACQVGAGYVSQ